MGLWGPASGITSCFRFEARHAHLEAILDQLNVLVLPTVERSTSKSWDMLLHSTVQLRGFKLNIKKTLKLLIRCDDWIDSQASR